MSIIHYERKLKLTDLYEDAVEISQYNFKERPNANLVANMVTLGMGRGTGQTTQVCELYCRLMRKGVTDNTEVYVITSHHVDQYHGIVPISQRLRLSGRHDLDSFRGKRFPKPVAFIFDSCKNDHIIKFVEEFFPLMGKRESISFILNINPEFY